MSSPPVKILLVDDEARNIDVLESLLQSPEYELVGALTADQALMWLIKEEFAAIVLDVQMPGMSGLELAALIKQRKRTQHIPIIFLTAYYQEDKDILEGYGSGAVDYLTKPVNPQILRSKIAVFVDLFRKTRALVETNIALEQENVQRLKAEEALRWVNSELEVRVQERTAALSLANDELRAREAALRASEAQARAASRAKDDFLAALSHELRTPLNPVLMLAHEAANDPTLPDEVRADFDMIRQNVELEARLIDDLLDLTRITRGKLILNPRTIDLHTILQSAIAIVQPDIAEKKLDLTVDLAATESVVWGDEVRLQQACWNVLKNAVKFTPPGGRIAIATETAGEAGEIAIRITDTGIGLAAGEAENIFEAFYQGEHRKKDSPHRFGGLGLGLAISRTLLQLHAGRIQASSPGHDQGTAFTIVLPLARVRDKTGPSNPPVGVRPLREAADAAPLRANGKRVRILLVEDHAATRSTLSFLLGRRDYEVSAVSSAVEARAIAGQRNFDVLVSDIGLPDGSGFDLLGELRAGQPELAGIALSGFGMEEDVVRSRQAGFARHIVKPTTIDALNFAILAIIDEQNAGTPISTPDEK